VQVVDDEDAVLGAVRDAADVGAVVADQIA